MPPFEQLGFVTCRSGILIVIDTGYLNIWSHDKPPLLPDGVLGSAAETQRANTYVDLRITGADAQQAGRLLDMSWHPLFIYDHPPGYATLKSKLKGVTRGHRLDAELEVLPHRVPHRQRVDWAIQHGAGAGKVQFHGVSAVAIGGVPVNQRLQVLGERMAPPEDDRWKCVFVECRALAEVARSEMVGSVGVDYARLLIADVDALG